MDSKTVSSLLERISDRIEMADYDDMTAEQVLNEINKPVSGEDPVYVLDEAVRLLNEEG